MRKLIVVLLCIVLVAAVGVGGFVIWADASLAAMPEALAALHSDSQVRVDEAGWIVFQPVDVKAHTGLILYPGGRVDPHAYAPIARALAEHGYLVVIVPMPLNLAVLGYDRARDVMVAYPDIQHWVIGGHSLGGAMAAHFAYKHPDLVQGLVLYAAYPPKSDDLSGQSIKTISIIGSRDGLGTVQGVEGTRQLLPESTQYVVIEGGNHAQFGSYGKQPGDAEATIARSEQQSQAVQATLDLLSGLK